MKLKAAELLRAAPVPFIMSIVCHYPQDFDHSLVGSAASHWPHLGVRKTAGRLLSKECVPFDPTTQRIIPAVPGAFGHDFGFAGNPARARRYDRDHP